MQMAARTHQTCLSKTFANSPNKQKLSKQVLVIIKHCLGNSQINSIPREQEQADIIHSQRDIKENFRP